MHQVRYEQRTFWRNRAALVFTLGLPVLMLVIFATLNGDDVLPNGRTFAEYFVPGMVIFGLINATYGTLANRLVFRRDSGLLKRARSTPLRLSVLIAGMLISGVLVAIVITSVVVATGRLIYDVPLPSRIGLAVAVVLVGAASFAALGLALATFIPNPDAADAMAFGTLLPLLFISGVFDQVPEGSLMESIADVFPVSHLFGAALATTEPGGDVYQHLAVVFMWGLVGAVIAKKRFRWEPR
jgi:ABC-2 type transport system permease protein